MKSKQLIVKWSPIPPPIDGWYWWRKDIDDEPQILQLLKTGNPPPYWKSWEIGVEHPKCVNMSFHGDGPLEKSLRYSNVLQGGEWYPVAISKPPKES